MTPLQDNTYYPATKTSVIGGVRYTRQEAVMRLRKMNLSEDAHVDAARAIAKRYGGTTLEALSDLELR